MSQPRTSSKSKSSSGKDSSKIHKLALKGSSKVVNEFFEYSINTILFQRGVYPAEDFTAVKKYGLTMMVTADDQVKAYIKRIMSQLKDWMYGGKISKLVIVITSKETGEHVERWQFDVSGPPATSLLIANTGAGSDIRQELKVEIGHEAKRQGELSARCG
ncbi:hypothetical protein PMIN04_012567 [Paraphaeosphaeria minitans]